MGIHLAGYGARTLPSFGIHDDLWAQALFLDDGRRQIAVITVDALGLPYDLVSEVRRSIQQETGLAADHIFLCATHCHSAPDLVRSDDKSVSYRGELTGKLRSVVRAAMENPCEAKVSSRKGMLQEIARNRRSGGGPMEPEVGILSVDTMEGAPLAVLVNYACHATVLGADNHLVTADYPGYMRRAIEAQWTAEVVVLFANGAAGNINPGGYSPELSMIGRHIPNRTFADAERFGGILADVVLQALNRPSDAAAPIVDRVSVQVELPLKESPDGRQVEANLAKRQQDLVALKQTGAQPDECVTAELQLAFARIQVSLLKTLEREGAVTSAEIQVLRIGDVYLVGIPGEPFVEIGLEIKRRSGERVFVIGYANGYLGYIPTADAYASGGYEPLAAKVAPGADAKLVNAALSLLETIKQHS